MPILPVTGPYTAKDQRKADLANKFIGRGSARSSTRRYAQAYGRAANSGVYTDADIVFVSAEGARKGRLDPDFAELARATAAHARIVTDGSADRNRPYNIGERQVAQFLQQQGYREVQPGRWKFIP